MGWEDLICIYISTIYFIYIYILMFLSVFYVGLAKVEQCFTTIQVKSPPVGLQRIENILFLMIKCIRAFIHLSIFIWAHLSDWKLFIPRTFEASSSSVLYTVWNIVGWSHFSICNFPVAKSNLICLGRMPRLFWFSLKMWKMFGMIFYWVFIFVMLYDNCYAWRPCNLNHANGM